MKSTRIANQPSYLIFTPDELKQNEVRKSELADTIASGETVLFVGAGTSASLGYLTWDPLIRNLEQLAVECGDGFALDTDMREDDVLRYAETIKRHIARTTGNLDRYHQRLYTLYRTRTPPCGDFHRVLVRLPVRGILTTNYDTVLEAALAQTNVDEHGHNNSLVVGGDPAVRVSEFLMSLNKIERIPRRVAHLHGRYDQPAGIVLSLEDYVKAYGVRLPRTDGEVSREVQWRLHRKVLWAILATRRAVFVGFSMNDPYLRELLETVSEDLWRWDEPVHFAIMDIRPEDAAEKKRGAEILRQRYGIEVVFYENQDGGHQGLNRLVEELAQRSAAGGSSPSPIMVTDEDDRSVRDIAFDHDATEHGEGRGQTDWLEAQTQKMEKRIDLHED